MSAFVSVAFKLVGVSSHLGPAPVARTGLAREGFFGGDAAGTSCTCHGGHHFVAPPPTPLFYTIVQARALMTV